MTEERKELKPMTDDRPRIDYGDPWPDVKRTIFRLNHYGGELAYDLAAINEAAFYVYENTYDGENVALMVERVAARCFYLANDANYIAIWLNDGVREFRQVDAPEVPAQKWKPGTRDAAACARRDLLSVVGKLNAEVRELLDLIRRALFHLCDDPREDFPERTMLGALAAKLAESAAFWAATFRAESALIFQEEDQKGEEDEEDEESASARE